MAKPGCSRFCSCEEPSDSIDLHKIHEAHLMSLKNKQLKTGSFGGLLVSALGTVDRMSVFNSLKVDHLPKQQVLPHRKPCYGSSGCIQPVES